MRAVVPVVLLSVAIVGAGVAWKLRPRPAGQVIRVGVVVADPPASNGARSVGVREGLALAQHDLEAEWAGAVQIELVFKDSGGSAATARERLDELHAQGVNLVAEIVGDDFAAACAPTIKNNQMLVLSANSTDRDLTAKVGPRCFRIASWGGAQASELARWARESGIERPTIVYSEGDKGTLEKSAFISTWGGLADCLTFPVVEGQAVAQGTLERLAAFSPDSVFVLASPRDAGDLLKQAKAKGFKAHFFGDARFGDPEFSKAAGAEALKQARFVAVPDRAPSPRRATVDAAWRASVGKSDRVPGPEVFLAYDALQVLARAARSASSDVDRVVTALRASDYDGTTGPVAFDENNNRRTPQLLRRAFTDAGVAVPFQNPSLGLGRGDRQ